MLYYVYDFLYWYTSEELGKLFVDKLGRISHVNSLVYTHWFMSIRISQCKYHSIQVDQDRYDTSVVAKYIDTVIKKNQSFIIPPFLIPI